MKRALRACSTAILALAFLLPLPAGAVSTNPTPVCSGATCTVTFTYTGDYYSWTAPVTGSYTLEVWGAQGGGSGANYFGTGGNGGYAKGSITYSSGQTLYIYPGQWGFQSGVSTAFNGGGFGNVSSSYGTGYTGGGATHIATVSGALSSLSAQTSSVQIVAGGGGGAAGSAGYSGWSSFAANGGAGGGSSGIAGAASGGDTSYRNSGGGGSQVSGGTSPDASTASAFGRGANASTTESDAIQGGGGGGGWYGGGAGSQAGGGGGGGSSYVGSLTSTSNIAGNATMPNPSGGTMTGNSGNGVARITYPNGPSIATFAPVSQNVNTGTITFNIVFNDTVTGLSTTDLQISGAGVGSCLQGSLSGSGKTYSMYYYNCNEGVTSLKLLANSVSNSSAQTGPSSDVYSAINVDFTQPTISSVAAPANNTYKTSDTPTFTLVFSESVTITGSPRLVLTVGSGNQYATFLSMLDSKTALFRYTVGNSLTEFDTDGIDLAPNLDINGGTIADLATNNLSNFGLTPPTLTGVKVMQRPSPPTITSITPENTQLSINFNTGSSNGSLITNYKYSLNGGAFTAVSPVDTVTPLVITGLTNGTSYSVRILAINAAGDGDSSTAVTATPSTVIVAGGSNISRTYGATTTTSAFTASGGTAPYTFSLSGSSAGISIDPSTGVVTASSTLAVGTYTPSVVATDSNGTPRIGSLGMSIVILQDTPTVTIALPNSATNAALGGAVTITASVSKDGVLVFKVDGTTISGCGSVSSTSGTATCSWTPGALGGVVLTAVLTPTDSTNYRSVATIGLSITVVNGVSTVSLSLTGGVTQAPKGQAINIIAAISQSGKVSFFADGKRIAGCFNMSATAGNKTCSWKPTVQKQVNLTASLNPTNNVYNNSTSSLTVWVVRRAGTR